MDIIDIMCIDIFAKLINYFIRIIPKCFVINIVYYNDKFHNIGKIDKFMNIS